MAEQLDVDHRGEVARLEGDLGDVEGGLLGRVVLGDVEMVGATDEAGGFHFGPVAGEGGVREIDPLGGLGESEGVARCGDLFPVDTAAVAGDVDPVLKVRCRICLGYRRRVLDGRWTGTGIRSRSLGAARQGE